MLRYSLVCLLKLNDWEKVIKHTSKVSASCLKNSFTLYESL